VEEESVKADCRDGVLEIRIAKPAVKKPRRIQIGGGRRAGPRACLRRGGRAVACTVVRRRVFLRRSEFGEASSPLV